LTVEIRVSPNGASDDAACSLLFEVVMRVLEARFYPERKSKPEFVLVGRLVWNDERRRGRPLFEPAPRTSSGPLLSKLLYLLNLTKPDSFDELQSLRSEFWAFIEVPDEAAHQRQAGVASRSR
jgi:hypothetical protein